MGSHGTAWFWPMGRLGPLRKLWMLLPSVLVGAPGFGRCTFTHSWLFSSPRVEASQVLSLQTPDSRPVLETSSPTTGIPCSLALLNSSPVFVMFSNCTGCPRAFICFSAHLINSHLIIAHSPPGSLWKDFCTTTAFGNAFQFLPTLTSSHFLLVANPEISWIQFGPIFAHATLLREWKLLMNPRFHPLCGWRAQLLPLYWTQKVIVALHYFCYC